MIPIFLGLKVLRILMEKHCKRCLRKDNKTARMITFAGCGADNIGVFVPYFTTLNLANLIVTLLTFLVLIYLLLKISIPSVGKLWKNIADGLLPLSFRIGDVYPD